MVISRVEGRYREEIGNILSSFSFVFNQDFIYKNVRENEGSILWHFEYKSPTLDYRTLELERSVLINLRIELSTLESIRLTSVN